MTIDEALERIKQLTECFIVWRDDTGEIVNIVNVDKPFAPEHFTSYLYKWTENIETKDKETGKDIRFASRYVESKDVDKLFLVEEQRCFLMKGHRVKVLNEWTQQSVDELISILETQDFPYPTDCDDTYILLERLFDFHWKEITPSHIQRLWKLIELKKLTDNDETKLKLHLLFFENRRNDFIELCKEIFETPFVYAPLAEQYVGNLQVTDETILKRFQMLMDHPRVFFSSKFSAMITLGKIGNAAGEKAAQIIEEIIYESSPEVTKARNMVLERIRTPSDHWQRCVKCRFGRVVGSYDEMIIMQDCAECSGIGWVKKEKESCDDSQ